MSRRIRAFLTGVVLDGANVEIQGDGPGQVDMITHLNYMTPRGGASGVPRLYSPKRSSIV
jgi:hypothetical protein